MRRTVHFILVAILAAEALVLGQGDDVKKLLNQVRRALGGEEKLASVKNLAVEGRLTKSHGEQSTTNDFELALELPDRFVKKEVIAVMGPNSIARTSGFNGDALIDLVDAPPAMGHGHMVFRMSPGSPPPGVTPSPEHVALQKQLLLGAAKKEFARLTLGMFAASQPAFPLEFAYGGMAESPDGKAHVIDVKGPEGFVARLFVDSQSHLPLMLSWMDKEPMQMTVTMGPGGGDGTAERLREAEAKRRTVEYRLFYGDYKPFNGVQIPTRLQRMIDGKPTEELSLEKIKVNSKIDPKRFEVTK